MNITPLLFASALLATSALAERPLPRPNATSIVHTADLDLSRAADQRRLDHRLDRAVIEACGSAAAFDVAGGNFVVRCRSETRVRLNTQRDAAIARSQPGAPVEMAGGR